MPLTDLQERVAALVTALPESEGFVLAGGAAMAAHGVLDRTTRDLDYFGGPDQTAAVHRLAAAVERVAAAQGLEVRRDRQWDAFVRLRLADSDDECEVDIGIDYRALGVVRTRYGPTLELRELGANKVLAIFARAEPRDFVDLAQLTQRIPLNECVAVAANKDPGLDLAVLDEFMTRARSIPRDEFDLDDSSYRALLRTVDEWRAELGRRIERGHDPPGP